MEKNNIKVGLLTFHRAENYGAILQAYALKEYLSTMGMTVTLIDLRCKSIERNYHMFNPSILWSRKNIIVSVKTYLNRYLNIRDRLIKKTKFKAFLKNHFHMTASMVSLSKVKNFDAVVVGSDQVWNLHMTKTQYRSYFLDDIDDRVLKVAYAASSEASSLKLIQDHACLISDCLDRFHAVSVRESFLKNCLQKYTDNDIKLCLDPTFLLDGKDYQRIALLPGNSGYILIYHVGYSGKCVELAENLARLNGCGIVEVFSGYSRHKDDQRYKNNLGIEDVIGYFINAGLVITTSFHGLALSVIFRKNFWIIDKENNERQRNLLQKLGLSGRLVNSIDAVSYEDVIDYNEVYKVLEPLRQGSQDYLRTSLHTA